MSGRLKVGRNDPCPCGSGKKYKKCHLEQDEAARSKALAAPPPPAPLPATAPVPRSEPSEPIPGPDESSLSYQDKERFNAFKEGDLDTRLRLLDEAMGREDWDDEVASEMLEPIHGQMALAGRQADFATLVAGMRERSPEVYREQEHWLVLWLAGDALALGDRDALRTHAMRMADLAGQDIDIADRLIRQLQWHGELDLLVALRERAFPGVRESDDIVEWGVDEFGEELCNELVYQALDRGAPVDPASEVLKKVRKLLGQQRSRGYEEWAAAMSGATARRWTLAELALPAVPQSRDGERATDDETPAFDHVRDLLRQFQRHLRVAHGVPWTRAAMMGTEVAGYLFRRARGALGPRFGMMDRALKTEAYRRVRPFPAPKHVLVPDAPTLDVYGGRHFEMLAWQPYDAVALLEGFPRWLDFLLDRSLVDQQGRDEGLAALTEVGRSLARLLERDPDPSLRAATGRWHGPPVPDPKPEA